MNFLETASGRFFNINHIQQIYVDMEKDHTFSIFIDPSFGGLTKVPIKRGFATQEKAKEHIKILLSNT